MIAIEDWAERILRVEDGIAYLEDDHSFVAVETDQQYILKVGDDIQYLVNKTLFKGVSERVRLDGYDLFVYCNGDNDKYRYNFENEVKTIVFKFQIQEMFNRTFVDISSVDTVSTVYPIYEFLDNLPEHGQMLLIIKEKLIDWIKNSDEYRLDYLLNPDGWVFFSYLDRAIRKLQNK